MAASAKTIVDSLREIAQDILVPEVKSLNVSLEALRTETHLGDEKLRDSIDGLRAEMLVRDNKLQDSVDALRSEMQIRDDRLHSELRLRDERMQDAVRGLSQKLDFAIDVRERLAALEARMPRQ
ncbi:MAG: hypothetical protein ABSA94_17475 [Acidobacteriaceae bacterium]|jgi:ABC-type phosphate transport system auxiliary subunit